MTKMDKIAEMHCLAFNSILASHLQHRSILTSVFRPSLPRPEHSLWAHSNYASVT